MKTAIDLFAGAGGFSTGARSAGLDVLWAANHWTDAVSAHARNHPGTLHACQDLSQADFTAIPGHDWTLASPSLAMHMLGNAVPPPMAEGVIAAVMAAA